MKCSLLAMLFWILALVPVFSAEEAATTGELASRLEASEADARVEAAVALGRLGPEAAAAVPGLLARLEDDSAEVRAAAAEALGRIGAEAEKVVPVLIEHFTDEGGIVREVPKLEYVPLWAIYGEAAGQFGSAAVDPLIEALGSESPQVYSAAAIGLGEVGSPAAKATPRLIEMLGSSSSWERHAAASALKGIGPEAAAAVPEQPAEPEPAGARKAEAATPMAAAVRIPASTAGRGWRSASRPPTVLPSASPKSTRPITLVHTNSACP